MQRKQSKPNQTKERRITDHKVNTRPGLELRSPWRMAMARFAEEVEHHRDLIILEQGSAGSGNATEQGREA